ncbi:hypothetical protein LINGRAHAP2_LOCUS30018, partial [Linum grandiflorum]
WLDFRWTASPINWILYFKTKLSCLNKLAIKLSRSDKQEMASMRSSLWETSNSNATNSKLRQTQIAHVRDLVYDVEDTIDQFINHRSKSRSGRHNLLRTTLCFPLFF